MKVMDLVNRLKKYHNPDGETKTDTHALVPRDLLEEAIEHIQCPEFGKEEFVVIGGAAMTNLLQEGWTEERINDYIQSFTKGLAEKLEETGDVLSTQEVSLLGYSWIAFLLEGHDEVRAKHRQEEEAKKPELGKSLWVEDDVEYSDKERLPAAYARLFGETYLLVAKKIVADLGDATYIETPHAIVCVACDGYGSIYEKVKSNEELGKGQSSAERAPGEIQGPEADRCSTGPTDGND